MVDLKYIIDFTRIDCKNKRLNTTVICYIPFSFY